MLRTIAEIAREVVITFPSAVAKKAEVEQV
jgi:hypothetical protein